jgi:hypothetical protein
MRYVHVNKNQEDEIVRLAPSSLVFHVDREATCFGFPVKKRSIPARKVRHPFHEIGKPSTGVLLLAQ